MYWPDKIWGKVIKKQGTAGGNVTCIMEIFKMGFGRLCLWGPWPSWFL